VTSNPSTEPADYRALVERILVQLADSLARLQLLLEDNRARFGRNDRPIVARIEQFIDAQIRTQLALHVQAYRAKRDGAKDSVSLARTAYRACAIRSRIEDAHSALRFIDVPSSLPETATLVGRAWEILRASRLGEISRLARTPPAVCLSPLLDPGEHIFGATGGAAGMSVVALAKIDHANPFAWSLLLHELGHRAIRELDIQSETTDDIVRQWVIEIGCDIIAMRLVGPAYYAAFLSRAIVDDAFSISTPRHPSPAVRAGLLIDYIPAWFPTPLRESFHQLLTSRTRAASAAPLQELVPEKAVCKACNQDIAKIVKGKVDILGTPLQEFLDALNNNFNLPPYPQRKYELATRLAVELKRGILIGGVRSTDSVLDVLAQITDERNDAVAGTVAGIAQALCDEPADLFDILNAADVAFSDKSEQLELLVSASGDDLKGDRWKSYRDLIKRQDDLVVASMETASFSSAIRGIATYVE
jgi:hypothetical protein